MARTYKALALLLSYPEEAYRSLYPTALEVIADEGMLPRGDKLKRLADELAREDILDLQARYVQLFDRSRHLSLHLYEHVHGESRDRGQAMVELSKLYATRGVVLSAHELPDHLPVFLEFLSLLEPREAAALLGEAVHVITALRDRLKKRRSPYAAIFAALIELADTNADPAALQALLAEPEDDPDDLAALDRAWAEEPVSFGPEQAGGCPQAREMLSRMGETAA
ncbi:MAG: nitrate reductase molybdenum cofactor assembly chaperone [Proteobacteria bacterium HN_bin10]|nr:MAG: nitrate reductase molybdenum cofactor assembly chaperone [Proteobacteria bacterium HN_bin10]